MTIDKGSSAGVQINDPVVNGDGLVGRVTDVTHGTARGDADHRQPQRRLGAGCCPNGPEGVAEPEVGDPSNLLLDFIDKSQAIHEGQILVTAGWSNGAISSAFPPGIPIGRVSEATVRRAADLPARPREPFADLREPRLRPGGHRRAEAPGGARMIVTRADRASGSRLIDRPVGRAAGLVLLVPELLRDDAGHRSAGRDRLARPARRRRWSARSAGSRSGCCSTRRCLQTLGVSSLVLLSVGYLAGRYREGTEISNSLVPPLLGRGADDRPRRPASPRSS